MGDIADGIVEGLFCEHCCCIIDGDETGYPRSCHDCKPKNKKFSGAKRSGKVSTNDLVVAKKLLDTLERARQYTDNPSGMYPGYDIVFAPGQFKKLEKRGFVELYSPHNPVHNDRMVITDLGREALETNGRKANG